MFKTLVFTILFVIQFSSMSSQSCTNIQGQWQNELGSVLQIDSISEEGEILGVYKSSTGVDGKTFGLKGWINSYESHPDEINISFSVRWEGYGSITSWTGYCYNLNEQDQIKTVWHLVRSGKEFDWERIISNSSVFMPININSAK